MQLWRKLLPISTEDKALKLGFLQLSNAHLNSTALEKAWWDLEDFFIWFCVWFFFCPLLFAERSRNGKDKTVFPSFFLQVKQFCFIANTNGSAAVQNGFLDFAILKWKDENRVSLLLFLSFSHSDFLCSHCSNNFTTLLIITLFLSGQKVDKNIQRLEGTLLCRDQGSSSILETVVKLETIWPIYLLMEKPQAPGQLELCLPTFWKSPKLKLMTRC